MWLVKLRSMQNLKTSEVNLTEPQCKARLASVADALYAIGGKWKLRIIVSLSDGNKRFNEMQRLIDGISAKVLSNELKDLELNGFVKRNIFTGTPVVVQYGLTGYSETLHPVLDALSQWGFKHRDKIRQSLHDTEVVNN